MKFIIRLLLLKWLPLIITMIIAYPAKITSDSLKNEVCEGLPPFCRFYSRDYIISKLVLYKKDRLACQSGFDVEEWRQFERFLRACEKKKPHQSSIGRVYLSFWISVRAVSRIVDDDSFHIFKLLTYQSSNTFYLSFSNLKGFDIDLKIENLPDAKLKFHMDFNLYKNNTIVKNCDDFLDDNYSSRQFIFRGGLHTFSVSRPQTLHPVCSVFFRNAKIKSFSLNILANSHYMKNSVVFADPSDIKQININSKIESVSFHQLYMIDIDGKLLNTNIFSSIKWLLIQGHLRSIEENVLASFRSLRALTFQSTSIMDIVRKQGIEWIKRINVDVSVDVKNRTKMNENIDKIFFIFNRFEEFESQMSSKNDDADFCLFVDFPFRQMVFVVRDFYLNSKLHLTCTELWMYQFHNELVGLKGYIYSGKFDKSLKASNFTACEFQKRIRMCNRSNYYFSNANRGIFTSFDTMILLELSFVIILPVLFGAFGIATNLLVIGVIFHESNKKTMRHKHYTYMSVHCLSNVLICFIQILNLLNECQYPYSGLFCSPIRHLVGIQYIRIVFGEYVNSVLRLVSNFTYFGFSICRLAKIGNSHSRFTVLLNDDLTIKKYMIFALFLSAGLSVCKFLQYDINFDLPELSFPVHFIHNPNRNKWINQSKFLAIYVINIIYNLVNYLLFVFVHLIVDLVMIRKLWQVIGEKEEKMSKIKWSEKEMEKMSKENEESKRRTVIMVICYSTLNFCLKIPLLITTINDLRLLIYTPNLYDKNLPVVIGLNLFSSLFNFKFYCLSQKSCMLFESFGNCLFLASLSLIFFFLKYFDMNFKNALSNLFNRLNKKSNKNT